MLKNLLNASLAEPVSKGLDLNDPRLTDIRRSILKNKKFLKNIYIEWYQNLSNLIPPGPGLVLELGSGAGFLSDIVPQVIKSELFVSPETHLTINACALPFPVGSLKAIVMTDVFHHIPTVTFFFQEAARCLRPGGRIAMIEPWCTPWSRFVYGHFHHEPFLPDAPEWEFDTSGPLSGANGALPWIVFERDFARFNHEFPQFELETCQPTMPFRYLISGGMSMRSISPNWSYAAWKFLEQVLSPWDHYLGMFALIGLRRR